MIEERIRTLLSVEYENRLLIHEMNSFSSVFDYAQMLIGVVNNGSVVITRKWSGAPGGGEFHQAARSVL